VAHQKWLHDVALAMLNNVNQKELPIDLRTYLDEIEESASLLGGSIQSRQIVALAVATFRRLRNLERQIYARHGK
jgi:hypothetical protein|tara:strand:+ start:3156 stop:3380 length:225 start_codon:yes stop_codon:yes gene_type:complete